MNFNETLQYSAVQRQAGSSVMPLPVFSLIIRTLDEGATPQIINEYGKLSRGLLKDAIRAIDDRVTLESDPTLKEALSPADANVCVSKSADALLGLIDSLRFLRERLNSEDISAKCMEFARGLTKPLVAMAEMAGAPHYIAKLLVCQMTRESFIFSDLANLDGLKEPAQLTAALQGLIHSFSDPMEQWQLARNVPSK